jgi:hypothetical protein
MINVKDGNFTKIAHGIRPDAKRRIVISKITRDDDITYHIYRNNIGQIVLDPQVIIPASEVWLFKNPEALASVRRGLKEAAEGKVTEISIDDL